jgi:oligopeptide transport system substrate-binding protein
LAGCGGAAYDASNILRFGNNAEVESLDPQTVSGVAEHRVADALFEGLVNLDPATLAPEPGVAESWEISEDGRVYTFHLRKNARWTNGDPVTAEDFRYSWQRILSPRLAADYAYFLHCIVNARAFNLGEITDFDEVGVRIHDPYTLEVTLVNPTPYFLSMQIHSSYLPVHRATIEAFGAMDERGTRWTRAENLVGNGPFQLQEWTPDTVIRVTRNPYHWNVDNIRLDGINFYPIDNLWTEERAFRSGELDVTGEVPLHKVPIYQKEHPELLQLYPYLGSYYYRVNVTVEPFDDVRVRRAFAMALDSAGLVNDVLHAGEIPARNYTPPGMTGYTCEASIPFDPAAARELLAEAGYPDGRGLPPIEILINTSESHKLIAEAVQSMWKNNLGADVRIVNQDWKVYLSTMENLEYMMARSGWIGDVVDPINFLECFLSDSGNNRTGYANPEFDALIHQIYEEPDNARRNALLEQAEAMLLRDAPFVPIYFYSRKYLQQPRVQGLAHNPLGYVRWTNLWLDNSKGEVRL